MKTRINILSVLCVIFVAFVNVFSSTEQVFYDDFETSMGWIRNAYATDNATTGLWERDDPEGTFYGETMQLNSTISGTRCLCTGPLSGAYPGTYDIDGGETSVRSPAIQLPSDGNLTLSFYYNFAHYSNATSADYFRVKIIGNTTVQVLEVLGSATVSGGIWKTFSANLNSFKGQSIYILIEAADDAEASLVEAAVEDVLIEKETVTPPADVWDLSGDHIVNNNSGSVGVGLTPAGDASLEVSNNLKVIDALGKFTLINSYGFRIIDPINNAEIQFNGLENEISISDQNSTTTISPAAVTAEAVHATSVDAGEMKIDGELTAKQVTVTLEGFPDYVFSGNHTLKTLPEVEAYINKHGRLPNMPSEEEVKENGVDLGKLNSLLVEKIEEMTLLMIALEKKNKALEERIEQIENNK